MKDPDEPLDSLQMDRFENEGSNVAQDTQGVQAPCVQPCSLCRFRLLQGRNTRGRERTPPRGMKAWPDETLSQICGRPLDIAQLCTEYRSPMVQPGLLCWCDQDHHCPFSFSWFFSSFLRRWEYWSLPFQAVRANPPFRRGQLDSQAGESPVLDLSTPLFGKVAKPRVKTGWVRRR